MRASFERTYRSSATRAEKLAEPSLETRLLDLHTAIGLPDLWRILRRLAEFLTPGCTTILEVESGASGQATWRRSNPLVAFTPLEEHSGQWLAQHVGAPLRLFSEKTSDAGANLLSILCWRGNRLQGALTLKKGVAEPGFSPREVRAIAKIQPHFQTALIRVLSCEEQGFRSEQIASMLHDFPIGLLVLDWELKPVWFNEEAGVACAVWNHGEQRAAALNPKRNFRLPVALARACGDLREQWSASKRDQGKASIQPAMLSHPTLGLHSQISISRGASDLPRLGFQIRIDYRRPRGDRHRAISPGALALLARLTSREWEVAMKIREGQRTAEIAHAFHRSPLTIKTQLASIFTKLGVHNRAQVAALLNR